MSDDFDLESAIAKYGTKADEPFDLHAAAAKYGAYVPEIEQPSRKNALTDFVHDVGIGTMQIPGTLTGIGDTAAGLVGADRPFSKVAEAAGEATGFEPAKWAKEAQTKVYSPERQAAEQRVTNAWNEQEQGKRGLLSAVGATLAEPRVLAGTVAQSAPSMATGIGIARGIRALAPALSGAAAGAAGEGAVSMGQQMEQTDKNVDPQRAALASLATGAGVGALGYGGAKLAHRLGWEDIQTRGAGGDVSDKAPLPWYLRVPAGIAQEGLLEEAPQSAVEQGSQNIAEGKDVTQGMGRAVTQGAIAGGAMGAGANILSSAPPPPKVEDEKPAAEVPPNGFTPAEVAGEAPTEPPAPGLDPAIPAFVDRYDAALAAGKTTAASATLRKAAATAGVRPVEGESDLDLFTRLKEVIYPKTEVQKAEENVAAVAETQKSQLGTGAVSAAAAAAIDNGLTPEIQAAQAEVEDAKEREAIQAEQEGSDQFDDTIPGWAPQTEWDKRMLAEAAAHEAQHQFEENDHAEYDPETGEIYGGYSPQPGVREEGGGAPISGAGFPQSGQENRNIQTEEINDGKSENQTAQTTPEEVNASPNLDRPTAEGMAEIPVPATGDTERQPDTGAKQNATAEALAKIAPGVKVEPPKNGADFEVRAQKIREIPDPKAAYFTAIALKMPMYFTQDKDSGVVTMTPGAMFTNSLRDNWKEHKRKEQIFRNQHGIKDKVSKAKQIYLEHQKLSAAGITGATPIDYAAQKEAAASRFNGHRELPENRDAQKKAYTTFQGIPIGIENPEGSIRKGKGWETKMKAHYGFFPGTKGADGDYLDTFVKPGLTQADIDATKNVYVVDQNDPKTGEFDEAKVMLGYGSEQEAKDAYLANYSADWKGFGNITEIPMEEFKERLGQDWSGPQEKPQFSRPDTASQFEAFGKFDKAPEGVDPRMAFIQNNFLDLLSELEASGKVQIKC